MSPEAFAEAAEPFIRKAVKKPEISAAAIAALLQQRTEVLTDIPEKLDFFDELPEYDTALYVHKRARPTRQVHSRCCAPCCLFSRAFPTGAMRISSPR